MKNEKVFKILAPMGITVTFKESMTEKELRELALQIMQKDGGGEFDQVWKEKIEKDGIEQVVEYLTELGYIVSQI